MNSEVLERIEIVKRQSIPKDYEKGTFYLKPKEWLEKSLDNITISSDYGTSESTNSNSGIPVLRMGNMKDGKIDTNDLVYLDLNKDQFDKLKLNKGDILFNRTNSYDLVGKVSLFNIEGDYICASYIVRFKIDNSLIDSRYVSYFMNLPKSQEYIKVLATKGVQQVNVNPTILKKYFKVTFPKNLDEQKKILDILDTLNKCIELKEKLLKEKQKQKKGLMERLLTGKVRLNGFNDEWSTTKLGSVINIIKKESLPNPQEYNLLTVKLHVKGIEATGKKPNSTEKGRPYYLREPGELLIGRQNFHNGGIGIVPKDMRGYVASNAITSLEVTSGDLKFYFYYLSNPSFYKRIDNIIGGTGQKEISETMIKKLKVRIPNNIDEQKEIGKIIGIVDKEVILLEKEIDLLKEQKKGLMQLLLTGIVRVKCD